MSTLEKIGQKLKAARESRGLSLGQIYDRTKIPTSNLEAIEGGAFEQLPEPVYVAGFIKRYAECVGLNGQNLAEEFKRGTEDEEDASADKGVFGGWGKPTKTVAVREAPVVQPQLRKAHMPPVRPSLVKMVFYPAFLIIILVGLIVFLYDYQKRFESQHDPSVLALKESASRFNVGSAGSQAPSTPSNADRPAAQDAAKTGAGCQVSLTASQHVWVEVKSQSTGESLFTGYLEAGDRRDFQDAQGLKVRAGNGGSLNVAYQGKHESFGLAGKVTDRSFGASGAPQGDAATTPDTAAAATAAATTTATSARPVKPTTPRPVVKKPAPAPKRPAYRSIDGVGSRYSSGDSIGGGRSIGVPYRYTDGRLDSE